MKKIKIITLLLIFLPLSRIAAFSENDCKDGSYLDLTGTLVDTRNDSTGFENLSSHSSEILNRARNFGPFYVLVDDNDNQVRPVYPEGDFFGTSEGMTIDELDGVSRKKIEPFLGQRVHISGCVDSSSEWPSVSSVSVITKSSDK